VLEDGSELAVELWATEHFASSSILCYPEGRAALAAARRACRLTSDEYRTAAEDLETTLDELHLLGVDLALTRRAGELAADLGLRGCDAVHLASAFAIGADAVVTWDKTFRKGVRRSGLGVAPAESPR
jgi:predicted nucleic acid-binding protein